MSPDSGNFLAADAGGTPGTARAVEADQPEPPNRANAELLEGDVHQSAIESGRVGQRYRFKAR